MTKSPPFASRLRLSKICRLLITLGVIKLALLASLIFFPQNKGEEKSLFAGIASAANPFAVNPVPQSPNEFPDNSETPEFGLTPGGQTNFSPAPPAPRIREGQTSPFAQNLPQYVRPDEATAQLAPPPAVTPLVPRDSSSRKQEELRRQEQELLALQQQMQSRLEELKKIEGNVQTMLREANTTQNDKMRHLIDVYANMKAKQAAQALVNLDERIATQILSGMRGRQAGEILTYMEAEKAAKLSEALARTQLPR